MKQMLSDEHRSALVEYRLERAHHTLEEADYMYKGDYFNASVNRLYYACFYAASALLVAKSIEATTHNGVKTMLSYHFVRTGILSLEHGTTFSNLFDKRHSGDYEDFAYCDSALVEYLRPRAESFIIAIEELTREAIK
ncbi:HEPN domain-containing protein [Parabacteroides hominis]|uniref:HEPN domain-containing protein n=1 Tax=Parabacteroides hominis TaxID=2763057 RepID=A0ABR7DQX0_9BACT|nr:HEPN domain-containing protein [Parabacteroides hominis]MBC5633213.1 HEPN domain-containing protein [Parabacteroides hominis]MBD9167281.1 HEPN domain-containing protein [Parabacteroides johnsonii]